MTIPPNQPSLTRRHLLQIAGSGALAGLAGCSAVSSQLSTTDDSTPSRSPPAAGPPDVSKRLTPATGTVPVGAGESYDSWVYDEQYPGPELRVNEGERLRVDVANQLPAPTTIHWHGVPVPNPMDGVPGLTQKPIQSGESFRYEFDTTPAGTYLYHSHVNLQLDRGLLGPLIIEEQSPHVDYDEDVTLFLDDYLPAEPRLDAGNGMGEHPPYEGLLINGQLPDEPFTVDIEEGQRVRLRFINGSSATTYHVGIGGHQMMITHTDGQPVDPAGVDSFLLSMGERYDVIVEADNPGTWAIQAAAIGREAEPAQAVFQYAKTNASTTPVQPQFDGYTLTYEDLQSQNPLDVGGKPDRTFDLTLSSGMMMQPDTWMIDGQAYPDADSLKIREGEHVRVQMVNHSMMIHRVG
jgi:FtsP/CotA-like multicopper oxidase with cupredoxin domain